MKRLLPGFVVAILIAVGLSLISYPSARGWWVNRIHVAMARAYYHEASQLSQEEIDSHFQRAYAHNAFLSSTNALILGCKTMVPEDYNDILNVGGVMSRLVIPTIAADLPVLHGTEPETLANGVGHLEGTSFPTGGYGTHSALTAHSGMPYARFFNRLHELEIGNKFYIYVLDRRLVYKVEYITIIWPHEIYVLRILPDADMVSLITCTPITVNTHRLIVRGVRIKYDCDATGAE